MTPEEAAAVEAAQERQLRDLATQIAQMTKLGFDPLTIRKGVVMAVSDFADPPTVSINISGDSETTVAAVRTLNNYTPLVGQTVLIAKQGTEIFLLGSIASVNPRSASTATSEDNGWVKADLTNGTHGGGDNDVHYRRVMDHGSWKMQWRGVWNPGGASFMIDTADALDPNYRPVSFKSVAAARNITTNANSGLPTVRMDFGADGLVRYYSDRPAINTTGDLGGSTGGASTSGSFSHSHGGAVSNVAITVTDSLHSHGLDTGSHSHGGATVVDAPTWISLNGVEYYL